MEKLKYLLYGIVLCALGCSSGSDDNPGSSGGGASENTLKVMSFNIRCVTTSDTGDKAWDVRKAPCVKMINSIQPDVIGMQEPRTAQRDYLKQNLPDYEMLEVPNTGTSKGGNSVLLYRKSRFTRIDWGYYFLSDTPDKPSNSWEASQMHTTVWAHLKDVTTGKDFWLFTTHMPAYASNISAREKSAKLNVSKMKELAGENAMLFITGDMNCSYATDDASREALTPYYQWMSAARDIAPAGDAYSFNNYGSGTATPKRNLDHIFYRNGIAVSFRTITDNYGVPYISDHYPILLTTIF